MVISFTKRRRLPEFTALCVLGGLCGVALAQTQATADSVYALLKAHRFEAAEAAAREYLGRTPGDCSVRTMLGLALRGEGRMDAAYQSLRGTTELCPESVPALEGAAEIAYSRRLPEAEDLLNKLLRLRPSEETAHAMLGAVEARSGHCEASVAQYAQSPKLVSRSPPALRQYGGCLLAVGRAPEAVDVLAKLLALEDEAANRRALARAQMDAGQRSQALLTLGPLLSANSTDDAALLLAAEIAEADNNTPQAVLWLRQAMQVAPKRVENYLYFAELSFAHGSYEIGIEFLDLGLRQVPRSARLYLARGVLKVQLAQMDAALSDFEEAHRIDAKLSIAEDAMGVLFSQKHDASAALALFEERSKQQPDDPLVQYLYAEALSETSSNDGSKVEKAITAVRRALVLEPSYRPARDLLCVLLLRRGDLEAVVHEAAEATKRDPYDEVAIYQALQAQRRLKHSGEIEDLVRRLELAKSHNQAAVTKYVLSDQIPGAEK